MKEVRHKKHILHGSIYVKCLSRQIYNVRKYLWFPGCWVRGNKVGLVMGLVFFFSPAVMKMFWNYIVMISCKKYFILALLQTWSQKARSHCYEDMCTPSHQRHDFVFKNLHNDKQYSSFIYHTKSNKEPNFNHDKN